MSDDLVEEVARAMLESVAPLIRLWQDEDEFIREQWRNGARAVIPIIVARERERCVAICIKNEHTDPALLSAIRSNTE